MSQTLQNQIIYAKSMNGIVTLSDGAGTTITDGEVTTDSINTNSFAATTISTTDLFLPRVNTPLIPLYGATIDTANLLQNMNWNTTTHQFSIVSDNPAIQDIFIVDVSNNSQVIQGYLLNIFPDNLYFASVNTQFTNSVILYNNCALTIDSNSSITFPRANPSLTALLGSSINLNTLCQNLNFNTTTRIFEIWDDTATGQMFQVDVSNNSIAIDCYLLNIFPDNLYFASVNTQFTNSIILYNNCALTIDSNSSITFPRANPSLTALLGSSINLNTLCQNLDFNTTTRVFEIWDDSATGQMFQLDVSNNIITLQSINTFISSDFLQISAVTTLNNNITFSVGTTFTLLGNISANSLNITPIELGRLDGVSSNIQTQLNDRGLINGDNTWSGSNNTFTLPVYFSVTGFTVFNGTATFNATANFTGASSVCNVKTQPENTNNTTAVSSAYLFNIIRSDATSRNVSCGSNANPNNRGQSNFSLGQNVMGSLPIGTSSSDNVGIGIAALSACTQGYYCFAQGGGTCQFLTTGQRVCAIGYACFPNGNPFTSICIGSSSGNIASGSGNLIFSHFGANALSSGNDNIVIGNSGASVLSTGSNNVFVGASSGGGITTGSNNICIGASATSSGNFTQSVAIGALSTITASNTIYLGTASETTIPVGKFQNKSQFLHGESTQITAAFTVSAPFSEFYNINNAATTFAITLPAPVVGLSGIILYFRRVSTVATTITSSAFFPTTSNGTASTTLLTPSSTSIAGNSVRLCCLQTTTAGVYAWYQL